MLISIQEWTNFVTPVPVIIYRWSGSGFSQKSTIMDLAPSKMIEQINKYNFNLIFNFGRQSMFSFVRHFFKP